MKISLERYEMLKRKLREYDANMQELDRARTARWTAMGGSEIDDEDFEADAEVMEIERRMGALRDRMDSAKKELGELMNLVTQNPQIPTAFTNMSMIERLMYEEMKARMTKRDFKDAVFISRLRFYEKYIAEDERRILERQMRGNYNRYGGKGI